MDYLIIRIPLLTACLLLFAAIPSLAQKTECKDKPEMIFECAEHDFGQILENEGKVSCEYIFTNNGNRPLVIKRVMVSCKCVGINYGKKPVHPGEKGSITVTYNPKGQGGVFHKAIQIFTNTGDERHIIMAKGVVVR